MTAFEELERGDIIWGTDPLSDKGRPMLVLETPRFPNHGVHVVREGETVRFQAAAKNWYKGRCSLSLTGWSRIEFPERGRWWEE